MTFACPSCGEAELELGPGSFAHGRAPDGTRIGRHSQTATCPACGTDFRREHGTGRRSAWQWQRDAPDPEALLEPLAPAEIEAITRRLARYRTLSPRWLRFLAPRRPGDEVWRYRESTDGGTALAVVRDGIPIATFGPAGDL